MKTSKVIMAVAVWVFLVIFITGCGGGSGPMAVDQMPCPDGSFAKDAASCQPVGLLSPIPLMNFDPRNGKIVVQFTGALDLNSITVDTFALRTGDTITDIPISGAISIAAWDVTFTPTQFLAYDRIYNLDINIKDSVGRPVELNFSFKTMDICTDVATFSTEYQACVSGIGVQTQVNPTYNTLQDGTCVITVGTPLTEECKAYMANGTMVLVDMDVVVGGHPTMLMTYLPISEPRDIILLDVNDPDSPVPISVFTLSQQLTWITGNVDGAFIYTADGKGSQLTVDSSSQIVSTCVTGCQQVIY